MLRLPRQAAMRLLSFGTSSLLMLSAVSPARASVHVFHLPSIKQQIGESEIPPGFTEAPGPVYYGPNPTRDPIYRGGVWNDTTLQDLLNASLNWGASVNQIGGQASIKGVMRPSNSGDSGGGATFPWEARYPIGGVYLGLLNTNSGNLLTQE